MPLTKRAESSAIFLSVKHHCIWQQLDNPTSDSVQVEVTNPETKQVLTKHGYQYNDVSGHVAAIEKYDRTVKGKRYLGYKMKISDGAQVFYLDMPDNSRVLRKFLMLMPNIDWDKPLRIAAWKARNKETSEFETALWFTQNGESVRNAYTRANPNGLPDAIQHPRTGKWDFTAQEDFLFSKLDQEIIPAIAAATKRRGELNFDETEREEPHPAGSAIPPNAPIDDVPENTWDDLESVPF